MIINPTVQELDAIIETGRAVVIDIYGEWCSPCKMFAPIFERFAAANGGQAEFVKADIDVLPQLAQRYGVMSVPSVIGISGGEVKHISSGIMNDAALTALLEKLAQ